jgi:hypothetical protein
MVLLEHTREALAVLSPPPSECMAVFRAALAVLSFIPWSEEVVRIMLHC